MDKEQNIVYIQAMIACANIRAMGMQAENKQRELQNESMAYIEKDFVDLIEEFGIHHNSIIGQLFHS